MTKLVTLTINPVFIVKCFTNYSNLKHNFIINEILIWHENFINDYEKNF